MTEAFVPTTTIRIVRSPDGKFVAMQQRFLRPDGSKGVWRHVPSVMVADIVAEDEVV